MKRRSIVIETMEKKLSPYGFSYSGYEDLRWTFSRDMNGNIQYVVIQKSYYGDNYDVEIFTSTNQRILRGRDLTGNPRYFQDLDYHNKEEQVEVLNKLANIVIYYGLDKFNTIKPIKAYNITITPEMNYKLFEEKHHLTQMFLGQNKLESLDDERVLQVLQYKLEEIQDKEFETVQDKIIEMAAVYGNLIIESIGGEWVCENDEVYIGQIPLHSRSFVLSVVVGYWGEAHEDTIALSYMYLLIELYRYIDRCRAAYGPEWIPLKQYRGLIDLEKLDRRRPWAIHMVAKYGADYVGDKYIREY